MAWIIYSKNKKFRVTETLALGREDFPDDKSLSREHAEISVIKNRVYAKDLNSTNGSRLRKVAMPPNSPMEVHVGDVLQIGNTQLQIKPDVTTEAESELSRLEKTRARTFQISPLFIAQGVLVTLLLLTLLDPSLAFGRSIGWRNLTIVIFCLSGATGLAALAWSWLLRGPGTLGRIGLFSALVAISAVGLYALITVVIDREFGLGRSMVEAKIKYFCVNHFEQRQCVSQVALCPRCASATDRWERLPAVEKLKGFRGQYPAAALARIRPEDGAKRMPAHK